MTRPRALRRLIIAALALASLGSAAQGQALAGGARSGPATTGYDRTHAYSQAYGAASADDSHDRSSGGVVRVNLGASGANAQSLTLPKGKSAIVELPTDVRDVLVTNPAVADAVLRSPRRIYVLGVAPGQTDAVFFDATGRRILSLDIRVDLDSGALRDTISRMLPGSRVKVESINNSIVLSGLVASTGDADKAQRLAEQYVAKPEQVLNMLSIAGKDQVMLKVRIVEMQRNIIKQLGFNLSAVLGQVGNPQYMIGSAANFAVNGGILGGVNAGYNLNTTMQPELSDPTNSAVHIVARDGNSASNYMTAVPTASAGSAGLNKAASSIEAFERVGLVRTLAEPNLTAVSGESAKFLAGGEYPVPTGEDSTGKISVEFKPFGVGLGFTPVVLSDGRISLKLSTEVSELSTEGAFTLATSATSTLTIPALKVRRAETTVELPSGGSMMIAGLMQQQTKQNLDSIPGMMDMPILGALFRSRDYLAGETELVILVTPYIVKAGSPGQMQTPADGLRIASDLETTLLGKLNKSYKTRPDAAAGRTYQGPYGYVIE